MLNKKILILLSIALLSPTIIFAQKEASSTPQVSPDIIEKVKDRLEKTEEIKQEAQKNKWYSQFGTVTNVTPDAITIKNNDQETEVRLSPEVELEFFKKNIGNTEVTREEIEIDWFAIAMGNEITNNKNLIAKRVSFSENFEVETNKHTIIGKIKEVEDDSITITNNEQDYAIDIPSRYLLKIKAVEDPELEDINIDDKIIAIISTQINDADSHSLNAMYIIPGLNSPLSQDNQIDEASPSAEASQSAESEEYEE